MTQDKFKSEVETLKNFVQIYCHDKHSKEDISLYKKTLEYKDISYELETTLCTKCSDIVDYSIQRLYECPYEVKPRCRKCSNSCYDKPQWKALAKIMMYSAVVLGLLKMKNKIKNKFKR